MRLLGSDHSPMRLSRLWLGRRQGRPGRSLKRRTSSDSYAIETEYRLRQKQPSKAQGFLIRFLYRAARAEGELLPVP
jgi:hypothetical protein